MRNAHRLGIRLDMRWLSITFTRPMVAATTRAAVIQVTANQIRFQDIGRCYILTYVEGNR